MDTKTIHSVPFVLSNGRAIGRRTVVDSSSMCRVHQAQHVLRDSGGGYGVMPVTRRPKSTECQSHSSTHSKKDNDHDRLQSTP
jgi:hypothetical protein